MRPHVPLRNLVSCSSAPDVSCATYECITAGQTVQDELFERIAKRYRESQGDLAEILRRSGQANSKVSFHLFNVALRLGIRCDCIVFVC